VKTRETARLAALVGQVGQEALVGLSHVTSGPAAKRLAKSHPLLAARIHVTMALRILGAKKSRYYDVAIENLRSARRMMLAGGRGEEWAAVAGEIREQHRRKSGFIAGFGRVDAGRSTREPSFLERARTRWGAGGRARRRSP
jgi:hypothetical protein